MLPRIPEKRESPTSLKSTTKLRDEKRSMEKETRLRAMKT
jgi:hypothetical protein